MYSYSGTYQNNNNSMTPIQEAIMAQLIQLLYSLYSPHNTLYSPHNTPATTLQQTSDTLSAANKLRKSLDAPPLSLAVQLALQRKAEDAILQQLLSPEDYGQLHRNAYGAVKPEEVMGLLNQHTQMENAYQKAQHNWLQQHRNTPETQMPSWLKPDPNIPSYMNQRVLEWHLQHPRPENSTTNSSSF